MKREILWLPLLWTAVISLLDCNEGLAQSQSDAKGAGAGEKGGEKVQLVISRWAGSHADDQASMLGEFEKATGIRVRMDAIDYGQLRQKQMLNMGGKTGAYDLVFAQEVWLPEYVNSGYLHALNDYVNDPALAGKDFDFSDFEQSLIQSDTIDGKLYGLPTFVQTPLVVFNKEVFGRQAKYGGLNVIDRRNIGQYGRIVGRRFSPPLSFVIGEDKRFIFLDRAADGAAKLILPQHIEAGRGKNANGVEFVITKIVVKGTMQVVGATLGDDVYDACGGSAKFRGVVGVDDTKFLH